LNFDLALQVEVDRRVDRQAALADLVHAVALDQLGAHEVEEVVLAALGVVARLLDAELARLRLGRLLRGDHPLLGHRVEDLVAAVARALLVEERVVGGRRLRQPGQQRRLVQLQLLGGLVEEHARGRLHAERLLPADRAVGHVVEVAVEDPLLGVEVLELLGELGLADLALVALDAVALGVARVHVAHQLHRQRGAALDGLAAAREVLHAGAHDALEVDALVVEEALVLDRHGGVLHDLRDVLGGDRRAQDVGLDEAQPRAVRRVDRRRLARVHRLELLDGGARAGDAHDPADRGQAAERDGARDHPEAEEEDVSAAVTVSAATPLAIAAGHDS
jgi:hypothetical protein